MTLLAIDWLPRIHLSNDERKLHWRALSNIHADWREAGAQACRLVRPPKMERAFITVWSQHPGGVLPDPDAPSPSVKAALDGIVDAGVLPGDTGKHVGGVLYLPPVKGPKGSRPTLYIHLHPTACVIPDAYPQEQP